MDKHDGKRKPFDGGLGIADYKRLCDPHDDALARLILDEDIRFSKKLQRVASEAGDSKRSRRPPP